MQSKTTSPANVWINIINLDGDLMKNHDDKSVINHNIALRLLFSAVNLYKKHEKSKNDAAVRAITQICIWLHTSAK